MKFVVLSDKSKSPLIPVREILGGLVALIVKAVGL